MILGIFPTQLTFFSPTYLYQLCQSCVNREAVHAIGHGAKDKNPFPIHLGLAGLNLEFGFKHRNVHFFV